MSRCKRGKATLPINVIEQRMRQVHKVGHTDAPTTEQLAERVRVALANPDLRQLRSAISHLVRAFVSEHAQTRTTSPAY